MGTLRFLWFLTAQSIAFCGLLFGTATYCKSQEADSLSSQSALSNYISYLNSIQSISFRSNYRDHLAERGDSLFNEISEAWKVDFAGKRLWKSSKVIKSPQEEESDKKKPKSYSEILLGPDFRQVISVDANTLVAKRFAAHQTISQEDWSKHAGLLYMSYPFGYIKTGPEYQYIPKMIGSASIEKKERDLSIVELFCTTKEYKLSIWLNKSKGWMPERIEYTRTSLTEGSPQPKHCLYTVERSNIHNGAWLPELYHCKISRPAGQKKLPPGRRIIDNRIVVVPKGSKLGRDYIEKPKATLIADVTFSDVGIENMFADSDFQFEATIPNGLRVSVQNAMHLPHEWRDGKIVPITEESLTALGESKFLGGTGSPRFWSTSVTACLVAILLYFNIKKWRTNNVHTQ